MSSLLISLCLSVRPSLSLSLSLMAPQARIGSAPPKCRGFTITLRRTTLGLTTLNELIAERRDIYLTIRNTQAGLELTYQQLSDRRPMQDRATSRFGSLVNSLLH